MIPQTSTQELIENLEAQIQSSLDENAPFLPKSFLRVIAKVSAGTYVTLYKYIGGIATLLLIRTAPFRDVTINGRTFNPLIEWGRQIGAGDPHEATRAVLRVSIEVATQAGYIAAGHQLVFPSTGVIYLVRSSRFLDSPTIELEVEASSDPQGGGGAGTIGNLAVGSKLMFVTVPPNVAREATVVGTVVEGGDAEREEEYRARVLRHAQRRPQGGAPVDYANWGESPAGIFRVYPYRSNTPGEIDIYVEALSTPDNPDGIPTSDQLDAVKEAIDFDVDGLASRRPINKAVNTYAITRKGFTVHVNGLVGEDVAGAQEALEQAADDYFRAAEPYIRGLSVPPRRDRITLAALSGEIESVAASRGCTIASVELLDGSSKITAYQLGVGEKAKLEGSIIFN